MAGASASNYEDLSKSTVGKLQASHPGTSLAGVADGKVARIGAYNSFTEFPISLLYCHTFGSKSLSDLITRIPFVPDDSTYNLLLSPYGTFVPRDEGKPRHSIGINLVLRKFKLGSTPDADDISFPIAVFAERKNAFAGKPDMKFGVAVIYKFK